MIGVTRLIFLTALVCCLLSTAHTSQQTSLKGAAGNKHVTRKTVTAATAVASPSSSSKKAAKEVKAKAKASDGDDDEADDDDSTKSPTHKPTSKPSKPTYKPTHAPTYKPTKSSQYKSSHPTATPTYWNETDISSTDSTDDDAENDDDSSSGSSWSVLSTIGITFLVIGSLVGVAYLAYYNQNKQKYSQLRTEDDVSGQKGEEERLYQNRQGGGIAKAPSYR